jgi:hypothetical protein
MVTKKAKRLLGVEFLDNDPDELILANYLKSKKDVKGQVLNATKAHLYAIALSEDPNSADEDVELAILESLQSLWGQMNYIVDYHRIRRKIHLTPQSLMRFGLGSTAPEGVVAHLQAQPLVRKMRRLAVMPQTRTMTMTIASLKISVTILTL